MHGISSSFICIKHHIVAFLPNTPRPDIRVSSDASTNPFQTSQYNLTSHFCPKGGVCADYKISIPVAGFTNLESPNFDVILLKICLSTTTVIFYFFSSLEEERSCPFSVKMELMVETQPLIVDTDKPLSQPRCTKEFAIK